MISSCYRIVAKNSQSNRPPAVLVKFIDVNKRDSILKCRKELRSSKIFIKEDLTSDRLKLLSAAINKYTRQNAWCLHGHIYVKSDGVIHRLDDIESLERIYMRGKYTIENVIICKHSDRSILHKKCIGYAG